jgi:hypothetical protein
VRSPTVIVSMWSAQPRRLNSLMLSNRGAISGIIKLEMISAGLVPANRKVSRDPDLDDAPPRNLKIVCIGLAFPRSAEA